ncbi:MAG: methyl acetate hydrolase [Limisphaerales bacterium]|jgi:methyl acetate hydrolase
MKHAPVRLLSAVALLVAVTSSVAELSTEAKAAIRGEIKAVIDEGHYPGISILLIHNDTVVMREAQGVANFETKRPFTVDELCWLASTGKLFTGALMARLVDEGAISFDDPIAKTFPEFSGIRLRDGSTPRRPVLLRHALSHTSGIPSDRWLESEFKIKKDNPGHADYFRPKAPQDFINGCLKVGLVAEPGAKMIYGRPIDLCASVVEARTGKSFIELMEARVFRPLGLANTTIRPTKSDLKRLAPLYQSKEPGVYEADTFGLEVAERQNHRLSTAGGGVYSTLDDIGTLMELHLHHGRHNGRQLIKPETLRALYEPQPGTGGRYGLAMQIQRSTVNGESTLYTHPGYSGPVAWFDFERKLAGVLLMQSNTVGRSKHHKRIIDQIHKFIPAGK